jgi:hypothetical protein
MAVFVDIAADHANLRTGLWCRNCNLPSGVEIPLLSLSASGVAPIGVIRRCHDCDQSLTEEQ